MGIIKWNFLKNREGSILILALWILLMLSIILIPVAGFVRNSIELNRKVDIRQKLHLITDSAVKKAINYLKFNDDSADYDSLRDTWTNNIVEFKDMEIGDGFATISYTKEGVTYYGIIDQERKLEISDWEALTEKDIKQIFLLKGGVYEYEATTLEDSILDWQDGDSDVRTQGAENTYYESLSPSYGCKNQNIGILEELLFIKGFTNEIYDNIDPYICVYCDSKLNINTASETVLLATGFLQDTVNKILLFRRGTDNTEGTIDDNVFDDEEKISDVLVAQAGYSVGNDSQFDTFVDGKLDVQSVHFRIEVEATLPNTRLAKKLICIVNREGNTYYSYGYFFNKD